MESHLVQSKVGAQALQLGVFFFHLLEAAYLVDLQAAVFALPLVVGSLAHTVFAAHLRVCLHLVLYLKGGDSSGMGLSLLRKRWIEAAWSMARLSFGLCS